MLLTIAATVVVLGVLIFVHELGHFLAAKAVGIAVPRFSIGLGPVTPLSFTVGETEYVLSWIPFGGYVKMASREESEMTGQSALEGGQAALEYPPHRVFENKPLPARILVISAGIIMNLLFAFGVHTYLAGTFGRVVDPTTRIAVDTTGLPPVAAPLGAIPFGTQVARINGDTITSWNDIRTAVNDPTSDRLRFDFAQLPKPVILPVEGVDVETRSRIWQALTPVWPARVDQVTPGDPADRAGLEPGDLIVRADGDTVRAWHELVKVIQTHAGRELGLTVARGDTLLHITVTPREAKVSDRMTGETTTVGRVGITPRLDIHRVTFGLGESLLEGGRRSWGNAQQVWFAVKGLVFGKISPRELGGPILIGQISGQFARIGAEAFLAFMAFFSVNLAILNLLPIPVLDGGHLVFLLVEGVMGRPVSVKVRMRLSQIGLTLLLGLMLLAFTNDILRMFGL